MGAPSFLIQPRSMTLYDCAGNLDDVNFVCVASESDYITWMVDNTSQDDIRPQSSNEVTYSLLPASRVANGSTIICKARLLDHTFIQSESASFTLRRKSYQVNRSFPWRGVKEF